MCGGSAPSLGSQVAQRPDAEALERRQAGLQVPPARPPPSMRSGTAVAVTVMTHFASGREDALDSFGVALRHPRPGTKNVAGTSRSSSSPRMPRHTHERPVTLMAHRARMRGVLAALGKDRRLRVDVERENRQRRARPEPGHRADSRNLWLARW